MTAPAAGSPPAHPQQLQYAQVPQAPQQQYAPPLPNAQGPVNQYGQPVQQPAWQPPPQQGYQPPQAPTAGLDMNARVSGPGWPQELQGKTLREVQQFYGVLRNEFVQTRQPQGGNPQRQFQAQPQQAPQGFQQPPQQFQAPQQPGFPQGAAQQHQAPQFQDAVRQVVAETVGPVLNQVSQVSAAQVHQFVAQRFPDWNQYAGEIMQNLGNSAPQDLLNPALWEAAYFHAKGRALSTNPPQQPQYRDDPFAQVNQQYQQPFQPSQGNYPYPQAPQRPQQAPGYGFVESPTPMPPQTNGAHAVAPQDEVMARKFGMSVEQYRASKTPQGYIPPDEYMARTQAQAPQYQPYPQQPQYQQPLPVQQPPHWVNGGAYATQPTGGYRGY